MLSIIEDIYKACLKNMLDKWLTQPARYFKQQKTGACYRASADSLNIGSAGFLTDLVFHGGLFGAIFGNQQFTMRNFTFSNAVTAIEQTFDWSWVYKSISISNCSTGISLTVGVGSVTVIDSSINDTGVAISSPLNPVVDAPFAAGSLILENVQVDNVGTTIQGSNSTTVLEGTTGSQYIPAWGQGDEYNSSGSKFQAGFITPNFRPASLLTGSNFYERSKPKPQYSSVPASQFLRGS